MKQQERNTLLRQGVAQKKCNPIMKKKRRRPIQSKTRWNRKKYSSFKQFVDRGTSQLFRQSLIQPQVIPLVMPQRIQIIPQRIQIIPQKIKIIQHYGQPKSQINGHQSKFDPEITELEQILNEKRSSILKQGPKHLKFRIYDLQKAKEIFVGVITQENNIQLEPFIEETAETQKKNDDHSNLEDLAKKMMSFEQTYFFSQENSNKCKK